MNKVKKLLLVLLITAMVLPRNTIFAQSNDYVVTDTKDDDYLENLVVNDDVTTINEESIFIAEEQKDMFSDIKEMVEKDNLELLSATAMDIVYDNDTNTPIPSDKMSRDSISTSTLSFMCSVYQLPSTTATPRIRCILTYNWHKQPQMTLTDAFAVGWSDKWMAVPHSQKRTTYWKLDNNEVKSSTSTALTYADRYGCGWDTDIKSTYGLNYVIENSGSAYIDLERSSNYTPGVDQLNINYTHKKGIPGSLGFQFGPASVSYSGSADADTRGDYVNFNY